MIIPIELRFKADKDSKSAFRTDKIIKSHDVNTIEFHITIDGLELTDNHTAKILSVFRSSESQVNVDCEIVEGKIIYKPDTKLISRHEHVTNYVYVYKGNQSLDVREFIYVVDLSKIDETSLEVKEVYDQSYANLLADFEQALSDYKDSLPQADSVRADIDEILNQFSEDSQAKLSLINEAEGLRVQAEWQRESAESLRVQSETQRVLAESSRVSAESERVLAEDERENAEVQRKTDHANRSAELAGKADKKQEDWITPTLLNGYTGDVKYRKTEFNQLEIRGVINYPTALNSSTLAVFTLMPDFAPEWVTGAFSDMRFKFNIVQDSASIINTSARASLSSYNNNFYITSGGGGTRWHVNITIPID